MKIVDANVLLHAVNSASANHAVARAWLDAAIDSDQTVGLPWVVLLAFIRLATHRAVFARPLEPGVAVGVVRDWLSQPTVVAVEPTARHADVLGGLLATSGAGGNLVNDAHLAALALEHDAEIVSFDTDFARFAGLRWSLPTAIDSPPRRMP